MHNGHDKKEKKNAASCPPPPTSSLTRRGLPSIRWETNPSSLLENITKQRTRLAIIRGRSCGTMVGVWSNKRSTTNNQDIQDVSTPPPPPPHLPPLPPFPCRYSLLGSSTPAPNNVHKKTKRLLTARDRTLCSAPRSAQTR